MTVNVEEITEQFNSNWYIVMRPFVAEEGRLVAGQVVDTTNWLHTDVLRQNRYIMAIPNGVEIPEPKPTEDGVMRRVFLPNSAMDKRVPVALDEAIAETSPSADERPTPTRKKK